MKTKANYISQYLMQMDMNRAELLKLQNEMHSANEELNTLLKEQHITSPITYSTNEKTEKGN